MSDTLEQVNQYKPKAFILLLGDMRELDLRKALPMTLGDWEDMDEAGLVSGGRFAVHKPKEIVNFLTILAKKVDPEVTRAVVRTAPTKTLMDLAEVLLTFVSQDLPAEPKKDDPPPTVESSTE